MNISKEISILFRCEPEGNPLWPLRVSQILSQRVTEIVYFRVNPAVHRPATTGFKIHNYLKIKANINFYGMFPVNGIGIAT